MTTDDLGIIEVPPELRGLSDEEILKLNDVRAKKSRSSSRPSKKERLQKKQAKERERIKKIAEEYERKDFNPRQNTLMASKPMPKLSEFENPLEEKKSTLHKKSDDLFKADFGSSSPSGLEKKNIEVKPLLSSTPSPSSGRVLKGVFGSKGKEPVKATIVKAEELLKAKALERAKKLKTSIKVTPAVNETGEEPPKRPRGRPRKNPI
ncbi:MAG TPA: hypothetical protein PLT31_00930 [Fibrobacteraceae bacterium]|jgi:hypothetical protein|nr:hypothetical protein [Fibrobacter sp.]HOG69131.1 hypothetical protein [Fibrobacteraceae bacterium]HPW93727.1 hypothetical protein [Fibrobacteraceae bacterium]